MIDRPAGRARALAASLLALALAATALALAIAAPVAAQSYGSSPAASASASSSATASASASASNPAPSSVTLGVRSSSSLGSFLTGPNGMTLYTLSSDPNNGSICTGQCLGFWPPLLVASGGTVTLPASAGTGAGMFARSDDGSTQVTYQSRALYYFKNDTAVGQTNGEGIKALGGVWHVAKLAAVAGGSASPAPTSTAPATSTEPSSGGTNGLVPLLLLSVAVAGALALITRPRLAPSKADRTPDRDR